jgi:hypothetical protein
MAAPDGSKIKIAGTGAIWYAPTGTTLPTDSTTALNASFVNVGYVGNQGGFTLAQDYKTKEVTGWQNLDVLRLIPTQVSRSAKFSAIETNKTALQLAWGNATVTVGTSPAYSLTFPTSQATQEFVLVLDWSDGSASQRIVFKRAVFKSLPSVNFTRMDEINYDMEIQAIVPADGSYPIAVFGSDAGAVA